MHPLAFDRTGSGQALSQEVAEGRIGNARGLQEVLGEAAPVVGHLRQDSEPSPYVLAAFCVMGRQAGHGLRLMILAVRLESVELLDRNAELVGIPTDLI